MSGGESQQHVPPVPFGMTPQENEISEIFFFVMKIKNNEQKKIMKNDKVLVIRKTWGLYYKTLLTRNLQIPWKASAFVQARICN